MFLIVDTMHCRLWRALRICKVLPHWQAHMHDVDVMPYVQCMLNNRWTSWKYAVWQRLLVCYLALNGLYTQLLVFFSGGILFYTISRRITIVCGKPRDFLPHPRHTLQPCLALLSTRWSVRGLIFFKLWCQKKKSIKLKTKKKALNCVVSIKMSIKRGFSETW